MCKSISMKKTGVTNPARSGFVALTSQSYELGDYLRKINSLPSLDANEEKELAKKAKDGDIDAKKELVCYALGIEFKVIISSLLFFCIFWCCFFLC